MRQRVKKWVDEAVGGGARLVAGGRQKGTHHEATLVADVKPTMKISCQELFGPAVAVTPCSDIEEAIRLANDTNYGLGAGDFHRDLYRALRFCREVDSGNLHVNWGPQCAPTDALRRIKRQRAREGRAKIRRRGNDGNEDGHHPRVVTMIEWLIFVAATLRAVLVLFLSRLVWRCRAVFAVRVPHRWGVCLRVDRPCLAK